MGFNFVSFLWTQARTHLPDVAPTDLTGRTVVVTGSNVGLGLEAAVYFAGMNPARLILAVRSASKGQEAAKTIEEKSGGKCRPEVWELDMARFESVKAFAGRMDKELERLDILVLNAGLGATAFQLTPDGLETTTQVNTISTSLLAILSLPLLKRTAALPALPTLPAFKPHLTVVTSFVHYMVPSLPGQGEGTVLAKASEEASFQPLGTTYNYSKAILMLNMRNITLAAGPTITVTSVDPGFVMTSFMRDVKGLGKMIFSAIGPFLGRTVPEGAKTLVWAALADVPSGSYTESCKVATPSDLIVGPGHEARGDEIWTEMKGLWKTKAGVEV